MTAAAGAMAAVAAVPAAAVATAAVALAVVAMAAVCSVAVTAGCTVMVVQAEQAGLVAEWAAPAAGMAVAVADHKSTAAPRPRWWRCL